MVFFNTSNCKSVSSRYSYRAQTLDIFSFYRIIGRHVLFSYLEKCRFQFVCWKVSVSLHQKKIATETTYAHRDVNKSNIYTYQQVMNLLIFCRLTNLKLYTTLTNFSMKYLMMCKVYTDVGGIK